MVKPRRNLPRSHLEKLFAFCILCDLLITLRLARWFGLYSSSIRARETRENKGATVHEPVRQRLSNNRVCLFLSISMSGGGGGGNVRATFRSFRRQDEKRREKAIRSDTVKGEKDFVATVLSSASLLGSRYARFKTKDRRHNAAVAWSFLTFAARKVIRHSNLLSRLLAKRAITTEPVTSCINSRRWRKSLCDVILWFNCPNWWYQWRHVTYLAREWKRSGSRLFSLPAIYKSEIR